MTEYVVFKDRVERDRWLIDRYRRNIEQPPFDIANLMSGSQAWREACVGGKCPFCGGFTERDIEYDAYFCWDCNIYTESKCDDPFCWYCPGRPDRPRDNPGNEDLMELVRNSSDNAAEPDNSEPQGGIPFDPSIFEFDDE